MSSLSSMARRKKVEEFRDPLNEGVDASGGRGILDGVGRRPACRTVHNGRHVCETPY